LNEKKKLLMKYGICILAGGLVTGVYVWSRDFFSQDQITRYLILCDGFTIPGFLMLCFGSLLLASNAGALDGISYGLSHMFRMLIPGANAKSGGEETYYDYVQKKKAKRIRGYGFMFFTGLGFMAIAMIFLVLFYRAYQG
jgi:hypothetical protein